MGLMEQQILVAVVEETAGLGLVIFPVVQAAQVS
jgi:hypothetical protein